ncbi:uncharacterized protein LOC136092455 [Hydra vulgaris]|uniref:Uncharacterized protein LOC136092455 n=1 Tax=Hydra vulgaris TaxID=6087 RepID=A0ABM4DQC5_HYDVU
MENKTVKELKQIAKKRKIKNYFNMRKNELLEALLNEPVPVRSVPSDLIRFDEEPKGFFAPTYKYERPLIDESIPSSAPILQPGLFSKLTTSIKNVSSYVVNSYNDVVEWIKPYVPDPIKKKVEDTGSEIKRKIESIKSLVYSTIYKNPLNTSKVEFKLTQSAVKNVTKQYSAKGIKGYDLESFMNVAKNSAIKVLNENRGSKVNIVVTCKMEKTSIFTGDAITATPRFATNSTVILESTNLDEIYETSKSKILETFSMFQQLGSNWIFVSIKKMDINIIEYNPLKAKSYIPLDKKLTAKKAIINIQNEDNQCFKWCIARALNPTDNNPQRIDKDLITQAEKIHWNKIEFPVSLKQVTQFEKNNQDISVNVYGYENSSVYPLRISKNNSQHLIDLLLISDGENYHYCLINNLSRLLSSQTSKRNGAIHYCRNCLLGFISEESLSKHKLYCNTHDSVRIELPKPGSTIFIKPINTCTPNPDVSYTKQYQKHIPSSFCYYIKCFDESIYRSSPVSYTAYSEDEDIVQIFVDKLQEDIIEICNKVNFNKPMIFTSKNKKDFKAAIKCHICQKDLGKDRVRDHCHLTAKYGGAAHRDCNLKYRIPEFFPVLFYNLSGYDSHLFIKKLSGGKLSCIPNNEEKYISFSREIKVGEFINKEGKTIDIKREIRFLDSYRFTPSSLDALSKNLSKEQCKSIGKLYTGTQLDLLLKKGIYPYDWVDSIDKFNESQLPPKESFFSKLNDEGINDDAYLHAQTVWEEFHCKSFRDYHNLYNVSDVLLLADVFENFRDVCMKNYKLDPAWYYTSPGLAWDAALRKKKVELELLSDYDMILMIQKGIRGGISTISNRLGKSNNKYMDNYDETKPSKFIQYLDANNLYGWAMSKPLPTHGFKWMDEDELENWKSVPCILEVDLDYPDHLHDEHNDYPLAPDRVKVGKIEKLIPNLNNKKNYVIHYTNLKLYERLGLKITKIHRGIKFEESAWLSEYIELNTNLRTKATNEFEKDFFKLMNNSVFRKAMENIEKRVDVRLVTNRDEAVKLASRPNYESRTIFDENLIAIHMKRTKLKYNKPIYLGMCILDLSKTLMYEFHYDYIKKKYSNKAKLLFTDTDSFAYEIKIDDFYEDIKNDIESKFDTSEFDPNHPAINNGFKVGLNKKVLGMFKDEAAGKQIEEFVGLRSKLYSYKMNGKKKKKM